MADNLWTLEVNGVRKTFGTRIVDEREVAGWNIGPPTIQLNSQQMDYCTFEQPGADFGSTPIFATGATGIIRLDDTIVFVGQFRAPRRQGSATNEGFSWRMENAWTYLETTIFRQPWHVYGYTVNGTPVGDTSNTNGELILNYASRLFLGQTSAGVLQDTAQQIIEIVNWAIAQGAPLQLDTADIPAIQIPVMEVRNAFCSECVIKMLQLAPDAVTWFDYSTTPYPTLKIKRRASLTPKTVTPSDGSLTGASIVPKDKLVVPAVVIEYERVSSVNGSQIRDTIYDIYPVGANPLAPAVLTATVNLEGANVSYAEATIVCATILSNSTDAATRVAWWKIKRPDFARSTYDLTDQNSTIVQNVEIRAVTRTGSLVNELTIGNYAEWMGGEFAEETITAYASWEKCQIIGGQMVGGLLVGGTSTVVEKFVDEPIQVKIKTTSKTSGTYRSAPDPSSTQGETVPVGLAQALYESANKEQYDGEFTLQENQCSGLVSMGCTVNISGEAPEYETMNATVQSVTLNVGQGQTTVQLGFPRIWTAEDFMEMLRGLRYRMRYTPLSARTTGIGGTSGNLTLGKDAAKESNTQGSAARTVQTWYDPSRPDQEVIKIDIAVLKKLMEDEHITPLQAGYIQPRVITASRLVNGACQNGKMIVIASNFIPT